MAATVPVLPAFLSLVLGAALLVGVASPAAQSVSFVSNLLWQQRFSATDLRTLDAGEAVVMSLDTPIRRELAHFGIVHIDAPPDRFVDRFRDIERFERGPGYPPDRSPRHPPRPENPAALTLPAKAITA